MNKKSTATDADARATAAIVTFTNLEAALEAAPDGAEVRCVLAEIERCEAEALDFFGPVLVGEALAELELLRRLARNRLAPLED